MSNNNSSQYKTLPIIDSTSNIIKPIAEQISFRLLEYLNIVNFFKDNRTYNIYYHDNLSSLSKLRDDDYKPKVSHNRVDIIIKPILNPQDVKDSLFNFNGDPVYNDKYYVNNTFPIFEDKKANIYLHEYLIPNGINLSFSIRVKSIELSDIIISSIYNKFSINKINTYNDISYVYTFPNYLLYIIYELYKLQKIENTICFKDYIKICSNNQLIKLIDKTQKKQFQLGVNKTTLMCLGRIDYNFQTPEVNKKNKIVDRYQIDFEYTLQYSRPNYLQLNYPIVINNKLIPEKLMDKSNENNKLANSININNNSDKSFNHPNKVFNCAYFLSAHTKSNIKKRYKTIINPPEDKVIIKTEPFTKDNHPIFQSILNVESIPNTDIKYISVDIIDDILPMLEKDHDIIAIEDVLKAQKNRSKSIYSLLNIALYQDNNLIDKTSYQISDDLKIRTNLNTSDSNHIYRIILFNNTNLKYTDKEQIYKAIEHHEYFDSILYINKDILVSNNYIKIEKLSALDPLSEDRVSYSFNKVYPGDKVIGDNIYGPYQAFRIGNFRFYPRIIK